MLNKIINYTQDYYIPRKQAFLYCLYLLLIQVNISGILYLPGKNHKNAPEITCIIADKWVLNKVINLFRKHTDLPRMPDSIFSPISDNDSILFPKLFWPTVRKNCCSNHKKLRGLRPRFEKTFWDHESLEQFIQTVKGQSNFLLRQIWIVNYYI